MGFDPLRQRGHSDGMNQSATTPPTNKPRTRVDWDAVERDYRATSLTLRELAAKHGCGHTAIANRVTRNGWTRDLSGAVRSATSAMLIEAAVSGGVNKAVQDVTNAVLVTASANTSVIMSHRSRLAALNADAEAARAMLLELGGTVEDVKTAAIYVSALESAARTTRIVIDAERKAFQLDEPDADESAKPQRRVMIEFVDVVAK